MFCNKCGAKNESNRFCVACGNLLQNTPNSKIQQISSKTTGLIFKQRKSLIWLIGIFLLLLISYLIYANINKIEVKSKILKSEPINESKVNDVVLNNNSNSSNNSKNLSLDNTQIKNIVIGYMESVLKRDFDFVYNNYLTKCNKYYDIKFANYENLNKRFEYLWSITDNNKYEITSFNIVPYENYYSITVTNNYSYFGKKSNMYKYLNDNIEYFEINNNGDIINIYDPKNPK